MRALTLIGLLVAVAAVAPYGQTNEPIFTADDLLQKCGSGDGIDQGLCFAYLRGFSDANRWLLRDQPVAYTGPTPQAVCIPNSEPIRNAADLLVVRFRGREAEVHNLSPFRAIASALAGRYPCTR